MMVFSYAPMYDILQLVAVLENFYGKAVVEMMNQMHISRATNTFEYKELGWLIFMTTMPVLSTCVQQEGSISLSQNFSNIGKVV